MSDMKSLKQYIAESAKEYEFRFKTIVELSDEQLDKFETHLRKYDAFDIGAPKRTILQSAPVDFPDSGAGEVFIIDFKTRITTTPSVLISELQKALNIAEGDFVLRNSNDPLNDVDEEEAKEDEDKKALLNDPEMSEAEEVNQAEHAGQAYVDNFLDELEKTRKELPSEYKGN